MDLNIEDEEFNDHNQTLVIDIMPKLEGRMSCSDKLSRQLRTKHWDSIIDRISKNRKVKIIKDGNEISPFSKPPLEMQCPNEEGNIPLFECLKHANVPFCVIKKMIDEIRLK